MANQCEVSGKIRQVGNNVSHANNKSKRVFSPNVHSVTFESVKLRKSVRLSLSQSGRKTIEKHGGLDEFLAATPRRKLFGELLSLKKDYEKACS